MKIKVRGGTSPSGNLCKTCTYSETFEYQNGDNHWICTNYAFSRGESLSLKYPVASCSGYQPRDFVSLHELKKIAWIVEVNKSRKIGFVSPTDRTKETKEELDDLEVEI